MPRLPKIRSSRFDAKNQKVTTYVEGGKITTFVNDEGLVCVDIKSWKTREVLAPLFAKTEGMPNLWLRRKTKHLDMR